jgi:transposase
VFVRVKSTPNSPRRSVQVVESSRTGGKVSQRIVRHIGIALDEQEESKLRAMAQEFISRTLAERLNDGALFDTEPQAVRQVGRPRRQTLASVAPPEQVRLADVVEVTRRVEGPHEVLGQLFDYLHFDKILGASGAAMLRDLVIARVMAPGSKRDSAAQLDAHYGRTYPLDRLYRMMDALHERLDRLKKIVLEATVSLSGGSVQVMLFDITTLYFESVDADTLRRFGYSKDQKYHCTQVVLALATDSDGLPIGYELFPGNTAEVNTLLACMKDWQRTLQVERVSFVADRALCSKANLAALEAAPWSYVVAMPLRRRLKEAEQAQVLNTALAAPCEVEGDLVWVREFTWQGRRLIVTYSSQRAHKDRTDRQALLDRLVAKLGPGDKPDPATGEIKPTKPNAKKLITNAGYLRYIEPATGGGGAFVLDENRIAHDAAWDGLHAIVTNDHTSSAKELLSRYRRLWVIEESFRTLKNGLAVRPIYHFKPERIAAHIGLCYLAFALSRHAQQRIKLAQGAISLERMRAALHGVQASIVQHKTTQAKYRLPSAFSHEASRIYKAFAIKRNLDVQIDPS